MSEDEGGARHNKLYQSESPVFREHHHHDNQQQQQRHRALDARWQSAAPADDDDNNWDSGQQRPTNSGETIRRSGSALLHA